MHHLIDDLTQPQDKLSPKKSTLLYPREKC